MTIGYRYDSTLDRFTRTHMTALPELTLPATCGTSICLSELKGQKLVLYFYPRDNTSGCTTEAEDFGALHADFVAAGCRVLGISRDSLKSHENFRTKLNLPFDLLSDTTEAACNAFGVIKSRTMYGKPTRGIERSTFVFDAHGALARSWRGVKVPQHAKEVLAFVQSLCP